MEFNQQDRHSFVTLSAKSRSPERSAWGRVWLDGRGDPSPSLRSGLRLMRSGWQPGHLSSPLTGSLISKCLVPRSGPWQSLSPRAI